jgi:PAS domain S-box-containing protein
MEGMSMVFDRQKSRRIMLCIISLFILLLISSRNASSVEPPRKSVLLINSTHSEMPFYISYFAGIREACDQFYPGAVEIFQEFMDMVRMSDTEYINTVPGYYRSKYASKDFDALLVDSFNVDQFENKNREAIFPGTPLISIPKNFFRNPVDVDECVNLILHLQPTIRKLFVINGSHPIDREFAELVQKSEKNFPNLEFVYIHDVSFEELMTAVEAIPANSAIYFCSFFMDRKGSSFVPVVVSEKISRVAHCPMYGAATTLMGHGIVGGPMVDGHEAGLVMGRELLRVLYGENAVEEPPSMKLKVLKQVDERQLVHWRLSESDLPPGYRVVNRIPSLWRDYKHEMMLLCFFIFLESTLIFSLLIQRRRKKTAEEDLLGTLDILEGKQEELSSTLVLKDRILENLRESEATLHGILSSIPVGVLIVETASGIIRQANRSAGELLGVPIEDIVGQPCPGFCQSCKITESLGHVMEGTTESRENCIRGGKGKATDVLQTLDVISLDGKSHIIECFLDITERKNAEREAQERDAQLVHADKMISLGTMAAGIGHEINNPNNFIVINAPLLEMAWKGAVEKLDECAEEQGDFPIGNVPYSRLRNHIPVLLRGIAEGAERIRTIVHDMKEFVTQRPSGIKEKIDINAVIQASVNLLSSKLNKSTHNLSIEYGEGIPLIEGNAQRLGQVIINIILNAAEALPDRDKALKVSTFYSGEKKKVLVQVIDEGIGIDPQNLKRIFDPFFTTKRESGGTGLGLAISLSIVKAHNGQILIASKPGEGTTATLELPMPSARDI